MPDDPVERFIALIRAIDPIYMDEVFHNGACYHLYLILHEVWPEAEPWYTPGHVYVKIGRWFYDIYGRHRKPRDGELHRMTDDEMREAELFLPRRFAARAGPEVDARAAAIARILRSAHA